MIWALMFQFVVAFVFIVIWGVDIKLFHTEITQKRVLLSLLGVVLSSTILAATSLLIERKDNYFLILNSLMVGILRTIPEVLKNPSMIFVLLAIIVVSIPFWLFVQFPNFLIFWIWFSKSGRIKIVTSILYVIWCAVSIWLCIANSGRM